ncbi:MAG: serine hydrolase [Ekhidna sp.]|nr:serine hydrolase [Ekhidna sp.]
MINDLVNAKLKASGKYRYSNIGYILLGLLLEEIGKDSYASLLQNTILNRAMMPHTSLSTANTATGGFNVKGKQVDNWTLDTAAPAGGVVSCTADIAKFLSWTMDSSNELTRTCIEPINKGMINGTLFSYIGLGWNITETGLFKRYTYEDNLIWHNGSTAGFQSYIGFLQKRKIGVVVLTNFRSKTLHAIKLGEHMLSSLVENREGEK